MDKRQIYTWKVNLLFFIALSGLAACGGNSDPNITDPPPAIDTSPDAFSFTSVNEQPRSTETTSNKITIEGINSPASISITGGEYSIDGSDFSSVTSTVANQQTISVRLLSSADFATENDLTITIGDVSETFSATTHGPLTRIAYELSTDLEAKYSIINQPNRGRVIVNHDLTRLTFQPMNSFDYLQVGETAQEKITVALLGAELTPLELSFTIEGQASSSECDDRTVINILPSEVNQTLTHISDGECVHLDASLLGKGDTWAIWTGENGAARSILFPVIGVNTTDSVLTFLPPVGGRYSLSWCPNSGACTASFYFYSDMPSTEKQLNVQLNIHNFHPENEIHLSVTENDHQDTEGYSYRWVIHDWTGEYHKLIDVITLDNKLKIPVPLENNNYDITVVVDDNIVQLEGGFQSTASDLYGKITLQANTLGNYKQLSDVAVVRDENSTEKAPKLVVMIDGDTMQYLGNDDDSFPIDTLLNTQLTFDLSESSDENESELSFYINGVLHESASNRFTFDITANVYFQICAYDGFPWTAEENPCALFDVVAQ
jgi:hypothetical protein